MIRVLITDDETNEMLQCWYHRPDPGQTNAQIAELLFSVIRDSSKCVEERVEVQELPGVFPWRSTNKFWSQELEEKTDAAKREAIGRDSEEGFED